MKVFKVSTLDATEGLGQAKGLALVRLHVSNTGTLDLTLSDLSAGNLEYVQCAPAGHILFGF